MAQTDNRIQVCYDKSTRRAYVQYDGDEIEVDKTSNPPKLSLGEIVLDAGMVCEIVDAIMEVGDAYTTKQRNLANDLLGRLGREHIVRPKSDRPKRVIPFEDIVRNTFQQWKGMARATQTQRRFFNDYGFTVEKLGSGEYLVTDSQKPECNTIMYGTTDKGNAGRCVRTDFRRKFSHRYE